MGSGARPAHRYGPAPGMVDRHADGASKEQIAGLGRPFVAATPGSPRVWSAICAPETSIKVQVVAKVAAPGPAHVGWAQDTRSLSPP